ncbi:glycine zipper family protein [Pseudoneobacillus rhizosphaerae]|nr:glycine zipper family protein [Pseudoneobacillus rhizosphaerae]
MSIGVVFGLTIFDNIGIGIPIGMCFRLAIGARMDADAKKKGNTF